MTPRRRKAVKIAFWVLLVVAAVGLWTLYHGAARYGQRLQASLTRALGRRVEFADGNSVEFSILHGPALYVKKVIIYEDPTIGMEPVAYVENGMEVRPSLWSLLGGKFVIASIRLQDASINLSKSGPAAEWGRWNFASFIDRSTMVNLPAIHVRNGRINFKYGDNKSIFYLAETDLDISPPVSIDNGWKVECTGKPARTDRPNTGLGMFTLRGRWFVRPERVDLDLELDRTGLEEWAALIRGDSGLVHGTLSSRIHLGGPIGDIGIQGRLQLEDVHRWDLMPTRGDAWPLQVRGRLNLIGQQLELQTTSEGGALAPLAVRFRAANYLSAPRWAVSVSGNRFPLEPLMQLARHMGMPIPDKLKLAGTADGVVGYSGDTGLQGAVAFHGAALTIPDSPPLQFDQAFVKIGQNHARLSPALVGTADDQARIEADYAIDRNVLDLSIAADAMNVSALRAQASLAAVPWLEQLQAGRWTGHLHYRYEEPAPQDGAASIATPPNTGWSGVMDVRDATLAVPALADPLQLTSAHVQIDGARVVIDRLAAQAGKLAFSGEYRYEPALIRPHRLRIHVAQLDAADLEQELEPTLRRGNGLLARALGRAPLPEWLQGLGLEGTAQVDDLNLAGLHLIGLHTRLFWNAGRMDLDGIRATVNGAGFTGRLSANLRNARPSYRLNATVKGLDYLSGKVDAEGTFDTFGTGLQLLTNLSGDGSFTGAGWDLGAAAAIRTAGGRYHLTWSGDAPRLHLTDLSLRDTEDTYTGNGATQENGHVIVLLSNGARELRVVGPLARLRAEDAIKQ